jgi:flavin reductase (DIM6/NTAB) family NADH-FMN oxidoreductase RutF
MRFDVKNTPQRTIYNLINGLVAPRPIALVTTLSPNGLLNAAPFSSFNYLCINPPILGLGVAPKGAASGQIEIKDTARNIEQTGEYVVNVVTEDIAQKMNICGVDFPSEISEPEMAGFTTEPSLVVKVPRLKESHAAFECKLYETLKPGTAGARIILGEVVAVYVDDQYLEIPAEKGHGPYIKAEDLHSIGRMNGLSKYVHTRDAFFDMKRMNYEEWKNQQKG